MKIAKLFMSFATVAALASVSCSSDSSEPNNNGSANLTISASPMLILSDGMSTAKLTVKLGDADVTSEAKIYLDGNVDALPSNLFSTTEPGTYSFYASCSGKITDKKAVVMAVKEIPEVPADPQPDGTSFKHRVLATQITGTACPNCPYMIAGVEEAEPEIRDICSFVCLHGSYGGADAFRAFNGPSNNVQAYIACSSAPAFTVNLSKNMTYASSNPMTNKNSIINRIKTVLVDSAAAGIAANALVSEGEVVVSVAVKAGRKADYAVDCWLLENGLQATQSGTAYVQGDYDFNTHNNVLRLTAGAFSASAWKANLLGEIAAGEQGATVFSMPVDASWNLDNCHVVLIVSTVDANGRYSIVNTAKCNVGGTIAYDYN